MTADKKRNPIYDDERLNSPSTYVEQNGNVVVRSGEDPAELHHKPELMNKNHPTVTKTKKYDGGNDDVGNPTGEVSI